MKISLQNVGKRFNRDWIFRALTYEFTTGTWYAITGPNGSGKSTLLQVIGGATLHNEGEISYKTLEHYITPEKVYKNIAIAAPYLELIEELTLVEFLNLHANLKGWIDQICTPLIITILGLNHSSDKQLRYFSSGMKQRVKLAQAIFSNVPILLLDEPITNLDEEGIALYHHMVKTYCNDRLVIVSSNDKSEYDFCTEIINIKNYKQLPPGDKNRQSPILPS